MSLQATVKDFVTAFNHDDLDLVMGFFAEESCYVTLQNKRVLGKAAIRQEFEQQFKGTFGQLRFLLKDIIIDEAANKAVLIWDCQHQTSLKKPIAALLQTIFGKNPHWSGLDVLIFNADGLIIEKHTYGHTQLPYFQRAH